MCNEFRLWLFVHEFEDHVNRRNENKFNQHWTLANNGYLYALIWKLIEENARASNSLDS